MRPIPKKQREEMEQTAFFGVCALAGYDHGTCEGNVTWDHPLTFAGSQIIDPNFTVPLCERHHNVNLYQDGKTYLKNLSIWVALNRATDQEIIKYSKAVNYQREKVRLNALYGLYDEQKAISAYIFRKSKSKPTIGKPKPFWVPLDQSFKTKVDECIEYYGHTLNKWYSQNEMMEKMIESCYQALQIKVNNNAESKKSVSQGSFKS